MARRKRKTEIVKPVAVKRPDGPTEAVCEADPDGRPRGTPSHRRHAG